MTTTVYGVWSGYEDMDGIFSTREKAREYVRKMMDTGKYGPDTFGILEYVVDEELDRLTSVQTPTDERR